MQNLTISIPTYNRSKELNELLHSLSLEFGEINVIVSDNASSDNTHEVVSWHKKNSRLSIQYLRNECNKGPDYNYYMAVSQVKTEYCFLFGSDDMFEKGAKKSILQAIASNADVSIFRRVNYDAEMRVRKNSESFFFKDGLVFEFNTIDDYKNYFNNCKSLGGVFSYISGILFKMDLWKDNDLTRSYFNSAYSHVAALFHGLTLDNHPKKIFASGDAIISCRTGNDHFASLGVLKRYEIDWDGYESLAEQYFMGAFNELTGILGRQMTIRQCLALSHTLKTSGNKNQIRIVSLRLKMAKWGFMPRIKWFMCVMMPVQLVNLLKRGF